MEALMGLMRLCMVPSLLLVALHALVPLKAALRVQDFCHVALSCLLQNARSPCVEMTRCQGHESAMVVSPKGVRGRSSEACAA
jgi:hypothetical protein